MAVKSRLQDALFLAAQGWRVFPLHWPKGGKCSCGKGTGHPIGKHPMIKDWQAEATTDLSKITAWWDKTPEANIGIATGQASNLIVLDIDGSDGEATVAAKGHEPTVTVNTGKGRQLYFVHPSERVRNKVGTFPQLDSRGDGGYVVGPGSLHQSGRTYHFDQDLKPPKTKLARAPLWWLDVVLESAVAKPEAKEQGRAPQQVVKGRRNSTLASLAGSLRDKGLGVEAIETALKDYNKNYCDPPLDDQEIAAIAASYGRYEAGDPNKKYKVSELANMIRRDRHFIATPIDSGGVGVRLMIYRGGVYQHDGADVCRRLADKILGNASRPDTINSVVDLVRERTKIHEELLNPDGPKMINVLNGMLDWREERLTDHSPERLSTHQVAAAWDPTAKSELLDKFLTDVFPADAMDLVEELLGYLCISSTKYQKAIMLVGEGANGKSTFLHMVCALLREENVSRMSLQQLEDSPFAAAELQGKLANVYADIPASRLDKSDTFKSIVAGDPIKAERKFGHPFTLRTSARLVFSANTFPRSADSSEAYFRRWIIIPFPNRFEGKAADPDLSKKLCQPDVLAALLVRAVRGLQRLEKNAKFSSSASADRQKEAYRTENSSAYEFIRECVKSNKDKSIPKIELYGRYVSWCNEVGIKHPVNTRTLNHTLQQAHEVKEVQEGQKRVKSWKGIELVDAYVPQESKY